MLSVVARCVDDLKTFVHGYVRCILTSRQRTLVSCRKKRNNILGAILSFSVIIPAYNRAQYIEQTLKGILSQHRRPDEIIVVNDGSTDDTAAVVGSFGDRVQIITIPNSGPSRARDVGVRASKGTFLAFCDSDDLWRSDHLGRLEALLTDAKVPYAFSNFVHFRGALIEKRTHFECDQSGFWRNPGREVSTDAFVADEALIPHILAYQAIFPSCTAMERDFYFRVGGYNGEFSRNVVEDLEFTLRCCRLGPVGIDVRPTAQIRKHGGNYSADWLRCLSCSIEILRYSKSHHGFKPEWNANIDSEIVKRSLEGIDHAFSCGRMSAIGPFARNLRINHFGWKQLLKVAVASMPESLGKPISSILTSVGKRGR